MAMIRIIILVSLLLLEFNAAGSVEEHEKLISTKGQIVFEDDFELSERDDSKEQLDCGWVTNSEK